MKFFLMLLTLTSMSYSEEWNFRENPFVMGNIYETNIFNLPLKGEIRNKKLGWPGNHWANNLGGIAHRWSASDPQNFTYKLLTLSELKELGVHKINELSPAEKYDIYNGNYHYPTVRNVLRYLSPYENPWHGICHGYAPASLNHPEPDTLNLTNQDGIKIVFYSSDVAAMMSYIYTVAVDAPVIFIGERCNHTPGLTLSQSKRAACDGLNPGSFHLILANKLGVEGLGFISDIERYAEVWNHVAVEYQSNFSDHTGPLIKPSPDTVRQLRVTTVVTYAGAIGPKFNPVLNTPDAVYLENTYEYLLDLDKYDEIIGGSWISLRRPDFVWLQEKIDFINSWRGMNQIYRSTKNSKL